MNTVVTGALMYAMEKHSGQVYTRKDENWPYFVHLVRVALRVAGLWYSDEAIIVALLHDVLEDTDATRSEIRFRFGALVSSAVLALTRDKDTPYKDYIRSLAGHPVARIVKIADLQDNLYHCMLNSVPEDKKSLTSRYVWALEYLTSPGKESNGSNG